MTDGATRTEIAAQFTPLAFVATMAASGFLVAVSFTSTGHAWFGVSPRPVAAFALVHAVFFACNVWLLGGARMSRSWWVLWLADAVTLAYACSYAATAENPVTPLWSLPVASAALSGTRVAHRGLQAVTVTLLPPLLRFAFTNEGVAVAVCIGVVSGLSFLSVADSVERIHVERRRTHSQIALGADAQRRVAELVAAMSLHDGLSGLLFVVRQRLRDGDAAQRGADVSLLRSRAEAVLSTLALPPVAGDLGQTLERMARELGATAKVEGAATPDALGDVLLIAHELLANAARHGSGGAHLDVRLAGGGVSLRCRSRSEAVAVREGRGLRNLRLRAEGRGGEARFTLEEGWFQAEVGWPDQDADLQFGIRAMATVFPAVVALGLGAIGRTAGALIPAAVTFILTTTHARAERTERAERRAAAERRSRLERTPRLIALETTLRGALARVVRAEGEELRVALDEMAAALADCLRSLEEPDEAFELAPTLTCR